MIDMIKRTKSLSTAFAMIICLMSGVLWLSCEKETEQEVQQTNDENLVRTPESTLFDEPVGYFEGETFVFWNTEGLAEDWEAMLLEEANIEVEFGSFEYAISDADEDGENEEFIVGYAEDLSLKAAFYLTGPDEEGLMYKDEIKTTVTCAGCVSGCDPVPVGKSWGCNPCWPAGPGKICDETIVTEKKPKDKK